MPELFGSDAFTPKDVAERVRGVCVVKARLPLLSLSMLAILAGAFIGLGSMFYTIVVSDAQLLGFAGSRVLGGFVFSMGLILVVVAGAELFTGNNLLPLAWADGLGAPPPGDGRGNWVLPGAGIWVGAAGRGLVVGFGGHQPLTGGAVARAALD